MIGRIAVGAERLPSFRPHPNPLPGGEGAATTQWRKPGHSIFGFEEWGKGTALPDQRFTVPGRLRDPLEPTRNPHRRARFSSSRWNTCGAGLKPLFGQTRGQRHCTRRRIGRKGATVGAARKRAAILVLETAGKAWHDNVVTQARITARELVSLESSGSR